MTGWKLDNLMSVLREAKNGQKQNLDDFLKVYPLATINQDYSILLIIRPYKVQLWKNERRILNGKPDNENSQMGLAITTVSETSATCRYRYLPNNLEYIGLSILGETITIQTKSFSKTTNIQELSRKIPFGNEFTEKDIETGFMSLSNQIYKTRKIRHPKSENQLIENRVLGKLTYNPKYEWYEIRFQENDISFSICICLSSPKKLEKVIQYAENQINNKFYEKALSAMENEMLALKNDIWSDEGEEITIEQFRKLVSIDSIIFYSDKSSEIYCNDGDMFLGHSIVISVDKKGKYINAALAG
ncbi:MAG: DUF2262 domain-containing protein [Microscillaceae bacterium]|jgi:hypothetical protein|nr:DUF2262 domain-containing protein [Microscillaceae bacterium]